MFFAIPFFKNASYLKETLFSLLDQVDSEWSAIVLDDSAAKEESISAEACVNQIGDSRIRYQKNLKNIGMAENWNQAFELAQTHKLFVILHADDRLRPDYVQQMKSLAQSYPRAAAFFCKCEIINEEGLPKWSLADSYKRWIRPSESLIKLEGAKGIGSLIPGDFIFCPSVCYRIERFMSLRFRTDLKMVADFDFILNSLLRGETWIGYYERVLFSYRRHTENTTVTLTKNLHRFREEIALYHQLEKRLIDLGEGNLARRARKMNVIKLNLLFEILKSVMALKFRASLDRIKLLLTIA
jgi:glycosyltransferase involved in cell wall biosynthesis